MKVRQHTLAIAGSPLSRQNADMIVTPAYLLDRQARLRPLDWDGPSTVTSFGERTRHSRSLNSMKMIPQVCLTLKLFRISKRMYIEYNTLILDW